MQANPTLLHVSSLVLRAVLLEQETKLTAPI
jgi:hypothetical protein